MTFELLLPGERVKRHQVMALHLMAALAMAGSGAVLWLFYAPSVVWSLILAGGGLILLIFSLLRSNLIVKPNINRPLRAAELLILGGLTYFFTYMKWTPPAIMFGILTAAVLFSLFWETAHGKTEKILIDSNGIKLPSTSRKRTIAWHEVEKVLLRFGTLTIDCLDNRLYQWNIMNTDIDKESFETFCFAQVEAGKKKRVKDW